MTLWHIIATACMINNQSDCFTQSMPITYLSFEACFAVIADPVVHIHEIPYKVMGSAWTAIDCKEIIK